MKAISIALLLALTAAISGVGCALAAAADPACATASSLISADFRLANAATAIKKDRQLTIAVVGSASSALPDTKKAYPARLEEMLASKLPGVAVKVITRVKMRESASEALPEMRKLLATDKPAITIWQSGTVEMMRGIDPDTFRGTLEDGIDAALDAHSDVILMNMQYSPRTELMMSAPAYADAIRIIALQHEILLFDRLAIMRRWGELGTFDLNEVTKKMDTANRVHDCIGLLLGDLILEAIKLPASSENGTK
jgi:hypothetical protein